MMRNILRENFVIPKGVTDENPVFLIEEFRDGKSILVSGTTKEH